MKILVIEDERQLRQGLQELLTGNGYQLSQKKAYHLQYERELGAET